MKNILKTNLLLAVAMAGVMMNGGLMAQVPEIAYDSAPNLLKFPANIHLGEVAGVATNSKGNIYVYTRTGTMLASVGGSRTFTRAGSRLFEFAPNGTYLREIGTGVYGFLFAHSVKVDAQDNIWVVDEGSNMVIKFNPAGQIVMTMGRKPEAVRVPAAEGGGEGGGRAGAGMPGAGVGGDNFNRPTDVAFDSAGNIFVADGAGNSRVAKFDKNGAFIKSWGYRGAGPGQFNDPHSIAIDAQGNVYVADFNNKRIQVFDNNGTFKTEYKNLGAPYAICISGGTHPYLFASNSNQNNTLDNGEIYKMELDGKVLGKFGRAGKVLKEFDGAHSLDCRTGNEMYVGEAVSWRVQKITLK
ncbi:MAG: peptidyl-alpha-hydroxyglycine alpha-amidating lyase family protein [Bryobacteraceae bacterium]